MEFSLEAIIREPLVALHHIFASHARELPRVSNDDLGMTAQFKQLLQKLDCHDDIPLLNSLERHQIIENSLVRYRGMIQDTFNPEYYRGVYSEVHSGTGQTAFRTSKYMETIKPSEGCTVVDDGMNFHPVARQPMYCVPPPGESQWAKDSLPKGSVSILAQNTHNDGFSVVINDDDANTSRKAKRGREENKDVVMNEANTVPSQWQSGQSIDAIEPSPNKKGAVKATTDAIRRDAAPELNLPVPNELELPCLVLIYEDVEDQLKLNDLVEFVGIISTAPVPLPEGDQNEDADDDLMADYRPPQGLVPRLHVIGFTKLHPSSPIIPPTFDAANAFLSMRDSIPELRQSICRYICSHLHGDIVAAEYILANMISRVYGRVGETDALGHFPINLTNVPADALFTNMISSMVSSLLPRAHSISMKLSDLQQFNLAPYKDYEKDRLVTGQLQLPEGTHIIVDETKMNEGNLRQAGYERLIAIGSLITNQRVAYDFQYYKQEFPTDYPVIVLSTGKSMFKTSHQVPFFSVQNFSEEERQKHGCAIQDFRRYLALMRIVPFEEATPEISQLLQDEFVLMRQKDSTVSVELYRSWLTLARLLALSYGETTLTANRWEYTKSLEQTRLDRVKQVNQFRDSVT